METYCLIGSGKAMAKWSVLTSSKDFLVWRDLKGRDTLYEDGIVLGHVSGKNFHEAMASLPEPLVKLEQDYAYRYLLNPYSEQGWLSPEGSFYGCKFYQHDDLAYALLRKSPQALEWSGWVRVHADLFRHPEGDELTKRQKSVLVKLGFEPDGYGQRRGHYEVRSSGPAPRFAVTAPDGIVLPEDLNDLEEALDVGLVSLVERMSEHEPLAALLEMPHELIDDVGPGTWDWMIRWDDIHLGGEESVDDLLRCEGLHLYATSGDTIEVSSWHEPGLHTSGSKELRMIENQIAAWHRYKSAA